MNTELKAPENVQEVIIDGIDGITLEIKDTIQIPQLKNVGQ